MATKKWWVMGGALAIGAGGALAATDLARGPVSLGPGVQLEAVAAPSAVPGPDAPLVSFDESDEATPDSPASPGSPDSPASADSPVSPASPDSPASPASPDSPASPASPDSAG